MSAKQILEQKASKAAKKEKQMPSPKSLMLPYQRTFVDDQSRFKIAAMARQTGKSFGTSGEAVEDCLLDPGTKWVCMSAGERQALEWLAKAKEWAEVYKLAVNQYEETRDFAEALLKAAEINFANGSRIISIPANPKTARGYSANIVLDEFAYHEDPDAIWTAMFPSITNPLAGSLRDRYEALLRGEDPWASSRSFKLRVVSTFNGKGNKFYDLWEKAKTNGYSQHLVTIHDAVKAGLNVNIEQLREALDNEEAWQQEYECIPNDASNVLLPYELIALAESADATEAFSGWDEMMSKDIYLGIDFGRQHDPTVCWALERIGDVLWTREVLVLQSMDSVAQFEILRARILAAKRVSFDYTGPGVGLGDYLAKQYGPYDPAKHQFGKIELCTFTLPFKRELFPKFRRVFESPTKIRVPISRLVREDLHAMQQVLHNGQYDYWAPRTREGHSDRCTAGALAVRAAGDGNSGQCGVW